MKKVITYGTYDLLHEGHINLLRRAKALGDWLIVGVTTDKFDLERGKMNSYNNLMERIEAVRATGFADQIIIEEYKGQKIDDIRKYGVDVFAIGSDWEGYFDYLKEYCEVVYLPRTEGISSTLLRGERPSIKVGIIGPDTARQPFIREAAVVKSMTIPTRAKPSMSLHRTTCIISMSKKRWRRGSMFSVKPRSLSPRLRRRSCSPWPTGRTWSSCQPTRRPTARPSGIWSRC